MKKFICFLSGCMLTAVVMNAALVFAETASSIDVIFGRIQLMVNGKPSEKETLLYNGTTYVPLRAAAEALDKEVAFDGSTQTAYIDEKGTNRQFEAIQTHNGDVSEIPRTRDITPADYDRFFINDFVYAVIPSGSMENTIMVGDTIFADNNAYSTEKPKRFDVVLMQSPDDEDILVKRIIGLPGETLEMRNGFVYINGNTKPLDEPYIKGLPAELEYGPYCIPENHYFLLGDNRNNSKDSRFWTNQYVKDEKILGKVVFIVPPAKK